MWSLDGDAGWTLCPICGALAFREGWLAVSTLSGKRGRIPGRLVCSTPRCGEVCKICHRAPGDVHGPDCGPLMFTKLERPHIVDEGDCQ